MRSPDSTDTTAISFLSDRFLLLLLFLQSNLMKESKPYSNILINRLGSLLTSYDSLKHLECDGLTQVLHSVLSDEKIKHTVYIGKVIHIPTLTYPKRTLEVAKTKKKQTKTLRMCFSGREFVITMTESSCYKATKLPDINQKIV